MKTLEFKEGDDCWIAMGGGKLHKGKVLEVLDLSRHGWVNHKHYVVEIPTSIDPVLEIRDGLTMSDAEDAPLGMWRR